MHAISNVPLHPISLSMHACRIVFPSCNIPGMQQGKKDSWRSINLPNYFQFCDLQRFLSFLVADTRLYTLPCRSVGRSVGRYVTFLNSERYSHYCSCPTVRDCPAVFPGLFLIRPILLVCNNRRRHHLHRHRPSTLFFDIRFFTSAF